MDTTKTELAAGKLNTEHAENRSGADYNAGENFYALPTGTVLDGRYRVIRVIRQGGFGITYEAVHLQSGERVAVKEYFCREICVRLPETGIMRLSKAGPAENPEKIGQASENRVQMSESRGQISEKNGRTPGHRRQVPAACSVAVADPADLARFEADRARFMREARILREFAQEPAVVTVLDHFEENGTAYIVMEYLDAKALRDEIPDGGVWNMETIVRRFGPVMEVLSRIHAAGVLHRDISPGNLMVMPDGRLKLIDFGAARELGNADRTHSAIYTRGYSAPEQRDEKGKLGSWTDVYGLCCVFWYCLTGRDPEDAQARLLYDELERPSSLGAGILPSAEQVLMQGLELDSSMRIRDVETLRLALEKVYPSLTEDQRREREARKKKRLHTTAAAGCFLLLAASCFAFIFRTRILFHFIDTQVVAINGSHMTPEEYADSSAKVRERVEALAGKGRYIWKEEEDQHILFEVPKKVFGDTDPAAYVTTMLTRPMILRIYAELPDDAALTEVEKSSDSRFSETAEISEAAGSSSTARAAEPSVTAAVSTADGSSGTAEPSVTAGSSSFAKTPLPLPAEEEKRSDGKKVGDTVTFSFDPEGSYRYMGIFRQDKSIREVREVSEGILLTFREEAAAGLAGFLDKKGHKLLFCFDEFAENGDIRMHYGYKVGQALGDGKSVLLAHGDHNSSEIMEDPIGLARLHYTAAPSAAAFTVQCMQEVRWEQPEAALLPGNNQTDAGKIKPPYLQLQYYPWSDLTAGEAGGYTSAVLSIHAVTKNRLDSLGIPYAVGTDPSDPAVFFVRIPLVKGLCREELEKLGDDIADKSYLGSQRARQANSLFSTSFTVQETGENSWQLLMSLGTSTQNTAEKALQTLADQEEKEVFLYNEYRPIAAADLQEAVRSLKESGTIAFTRWAFSEKQTMDAGTLPLGRFIATCFEQNPEEDYYLGETQVHEADGTIRFFNEGLPDRIDKDPAEKWAAEQVLPWKSAELAYESRERRLRVRLHDYPLEQPEQCLAVGRELFDSADKAGVILNECTLSCYEKSADTFGGWYMESVCLHFCEDFETGSMLLNYGSIYGFLKEDPEEVRRAERLRGIYYRAFEDSAYWRKMLSEKAQEKREEFFYIPDQ